MTDTTIKNAELTENHENFPSQFGIGDPVKIKINDIEISGWIRAVLFTNGKVRYCVRIKVNEEYDESYTTFHNIDSVFVVSNPEGEKMEWIFDNHS
ncbi:MAG: hypothetical protein ACP6IQ_02595 [Candidatus Njordarchaeia archaeon]